MLNYDYTTTTMQPYENIEAKDDNTMIEISLKEYKELLEYKGRYLELCNVYYSSPKINLRGSTSGITYCGDNKNDKY